MHSKDYWSVSVQLCLFQAIVSIGICISKSISNEVHISPKSCALFWTPAHLKELVRGPLRKSGQTFVSRSFDPSGSFILKLRGGGSDAELEEADAPAKRKVANVKKDIDESQKKKPVKAKAAKATAKTSASDSETVPAAKSAPKAKATAKSKPKSTANDKSEDPFSVLFHLDLLSAILIYCTSP